MILGLLIGLMGGIGLAFLFEYLDNSVKSADDVEKNASLPTLGIVSTFSAESFKKGYGYGYGYGYGDKKKTKKENKGDKADSTGIGEGIMAAGSALKGSAATGAKGEKEEPLPVIKSIELITHFAPKSNFSESYRSIRTALLLSSTDSKMKALVVTSPLAAEGKTATVSNLAVTLAQANKKVLLVDADLRKPRLHKIFRIKNLVGLTNYLTSDVDIKELIKATEVPNLYFVNSGPVPPNPAELLGSDKMAHFIDSLERTFDYALFDTPPLLAVTDAVVMGPKIGIILIVWGGKTSREALKRAREKLDLTKIKSLGVIINKLSPREHDYYYKHYYYHYYGES
jgi:capsular exopolysaccharide synthesis family protein